MKEYKIVVDFDQKEAFGCYERNSLGFFSSPWEAIERTPTRAEAIVLLESKEGRFIGTFLKDGTRVAVNDEVRPDKGNTYSSEGLPVKKALKSVPNFADDDATVLHSRKVASVANRK